MTPAEDDPQHLQRNGFHELTRSASGHSLPSGSLHVNGLNGSSNSSLYSSPGPEPALHQRRPVRWAADMPGPQQTQQQQSQQPQPPRRECGGCSMCQGAPAAAAAVSSLCGIARAPLAMVGGVLLVVAIAGAALLALCFRVAVAPFSRAYARRLQCEYAAAPLLDAAALILPRAQVHMTGDLEVLRGPSPGYALLNTDDMENGCLVPWWALLVALRHVGIHGMAKVPLPASALGLPLAGWLLSLLEFPVLDDGAGIRNCMESFAEDSAATGDPYLFIVEHSAARYHAHKLGLSPCLHALRAAHPSVYDITVAPLRSRGGRSGAGSSKWARLRSLMASPGQVHMRLSCHGAEEVLQNPHWLEERQAAAARARAHFARHGTLPVDSPRRAGGFQTSAAAVCFTADTRAPHRMEAGALALARLVLVPLVLPPLLLASLPALLLVAVVVIMWHAMCRAVRTLWGAVSPWQPSPRIPNSSAHGTEDDDCPSRSATPWWLGPLTPLNTPAPFLVNPCAPPPAARRQPGRGGGSGGGGSGGGGGARQ